MTDTCPRCGWAHSDQPVPTSVVDWPEDLPTPPPLPTEALPHPAGRCCSPFAIGDLLYWNCADALQDGPPLRVLFKELVEIQGADYQLQDNKWVREGEPCPMIATVLVDNKAIYPCHVDLFGLELLDRELEVKIENLTPVTAWPVIEID